MRQRTERGRVLYLRWRCSELYPIDFVAMREIPVPHTFSQMTSPDAMGAHKERPAALRATSPARALGTGALVR